MNSVFSHKTVLFFFLKRSVQVSLGRWIWYFLPYLVCLALQWSMKSAVSHLKPYKFILLQRMQFHGDKGWFSYTEKLITQDYERLKMFLQLQMIVKFDSTLDGNPFSH